MLEVLKKIHLQNMILISGNDVILHYTKQSFVILKPICYIETQHPLLTFFLLTLQTRLKYQDISWIYS